MIACIMQPTYLPWIGYIDLIDQSDTFVFLDNVALSQGRSWQQRNRIATPQGPLWLTVPVLRRAGQLISEVRIDNTQPWRRKHWTAISMHYRATPHWERYGPALCAVYEREWNLLAELNIVLIELLCDLAGVKAHFVRASTLEPLAGERVAKLVEICRRVGADTYLSPLGSLEYLRSSDEFDLAEIDLVFHTYQHPAYRQASGSFLDHLSFLDALMNLGETATGVMRSGRRPSLRRGELADTEPAPGRRSV